MNKMMTEQKNNFKDALLTAYLDFRGFSVRAKAAEGQVTFEVTGERL